MAEETGSEVRPEPSPTPEAPAQEPVYAVSARKPGLVERVVSDVKGKTARIWRPRWDLSTFLYGLVVLLLLILIAENWAPCAVNLLGWRFELPIPVLFVVNLGIGALLLWLWQRRAARADDADKGGE